VSDVWYNAAAWAQAVGTIAAVLGSAWLAARESRAALRREEAARIATKAAALNLAIVASAQIGNLHDLLRDETRRGRLNHISPSRGFLANQTMLTRFPIESLEDPDAMIAFTYFPGALSMAAEIYSHLEEAVRAAEDDDPVEVFAHYAGQLELVRKHCEERLDELKAALKLADGVGAGAARMPIRMLRHIERRRRGPRQAEAAEL